MAFQHLSILQKYCDGTFEAFYQELLQDVKLRKFFRDAQHIQDLIVKQKANFISTLDMSKEDIKKNYIDLGKLHYDLNIPYINFITGSEILEEDFLLQVKQKELSVDLVHEVLEYFKLMNAYIAKGYLRRMLRDDRKEIESFAVQIEQSQTNLPKQLILDKIKWVVSFMGLVEHARPMAHDIEIKSKEWLQELKEVETQTLFLENIQERIYNDTKNLFYFLKKEEYRDVLPLYSALITIYKLMLTMSDSLHQNNSNEATIDLADTLELNNKDFFEEIVHKEFAFQRRDGEYSFTLLYLSCEGFDEIKERYGQLNANRVLKHMGEVIGEHIRSSDFCFHIEEDLFTIILKNAKRQMARKIAKKIAIDFNSYSFIFEQENIIHVNLNVGIAEQSNVTPHQEIQELFNSAQEDLHRSKEVKES